MTQQMPPDRRAEALAFNAVGKSLAHHDRWLPLSVRRGIAAEVVAALADPGHLVLVVAANVDDYVDWCEDRGWPPFVGSAWAISSATGVPRSRVFQVTPRWRETRSNRRLVRALQEAAVRYGDEHGPLPAERVPDLAWPWWQRAVRGTR